MISNPVIIQRQYAHDCPKNDCAQESVIRRCQNAFTASLPLISLIPGSKTPLALGLGFLRNVNHLQNVICAFQQKDYANFSVHSLQLALGLTALAIIIACLANQSLNPSYSYLAIDADDLVSNIRELREAIKKGETKQIVETLSHMSATLLFAAYLSFGQIEILVTLMLVQISHNLGKSADEFRQGHYFEGLCYLAFSIVSIFQVIPQIKVVEWKWKRGGTIEGELCRDERGFVYIKIKDEIVFELHEIFGDSLPPYFGKDKHGAHISVMSAGELSKQINIDEIGKTFKFEIASFDSLRPDNFKGVEKVSFLSLASSELEALRSKYGLTSKIHGNHDFHITFSVKYIKA